MVEFIVNEDGTLMISADDVAVAQQFFPEHAEELKAFAEVVRSDLVVGDSIHCG